MQKRRDLFQIIRSKKYNIACFQDVHIDRKMYSYVKSEWRYNMVLSSKEGTNASRGVMILINNNFAYYRTNFNRPGWKFYHYGINNSHQKNYSSQHLQSK